VTVEADALAVQGTPSCEYAHQRTADHELPTNGRNVIGWRHWTWRQRTAGHGEPVLVTANYSISFNGLNRRTRVMIDGAEAYDRGSGGKMSVMPSQDSLVIQVLASNYLRITVLLRGTITCLSRALEEFHGGVGVRPQRRTGCARMERQQ